MTQILECGISSGVNLCILHQFKALLSPSKPFAQFARQSGFPIARQRRRKKISPVQEYSQWVCLSRVNSAPCTYSDIYYHSNTFLGTKHHPRAVSLSVLGNLTPKWEMFFQNLFCPKLVCSCFKWDTFDAFFPPRWKMCLQLFDAQLEAAASGCHLSKSEGQNWNGKNEYRSMCRFRRRSAVWALNLNYWLPFFFCLAAQVLSKEPSMQLNNLACNLNNLHGQK